MPSKTIDIIDSMDIKSLVKRFSKVTAIIAIVFAMSSCLSSCTQKVEYDTPILKTFLKDSNKPAVFKFYADWCSSCKDYAPTFEKVAAEYEGSVDFYEIDIDQKQYAELVTEFKIARIPETLFVSLDRNSVKKRLGPISYKSLKDAIENLKAKQNN